MRDINGIRPYLPFTRNVFQRLISYKANAILFMFGDFLMLAVTYYLWKAIYGSTIETVLNGFTFNEMIIYLFISFLTSVMISVDISYEISREVKDGSIAINLVRPINYEKRMFFQGLGNVLYNFVIIFIIAFSVTSAVHNKNMSSPGLFRRCPRRLPSVPAHRLWLRYRVSGHPERLPRRFLPYRRASPRLPALW